MMIKWKKLLEPFGAIYREAEAEMEARIKEMNAAELRQLIRATMFPTQTNCGWDIYHVRARVRGMASYRLRQIESPTPEPEGR